MKNAWLSNPHLQARRGKKPLCCRATTRLRSPHASRVAHVESWVLSIEVPNGFPRLLGHVQKHLNRTAATFEDKQNMAATGSLRLNLTILDTCRLEYTVSLTECGTVTLPSPRRRRCTAALAACQRTFTTLPALSTQAAKCATVVLSLNRRLRGSTNLL